MIEQRRHLRYRVETSQLAKAWFEGMPGGPAHRPVLIANLSYSGCNLVAMGEPVEIAAGDELRLEFDPDDAVDMAVIRVERLTARSLRISCRFLE